ncbi:MAG: hypothetical protein ACYC18_12865, partial [Gammaproteobacteria bacterium]
MDRDVSSMRATQDEREETYDVISTPYPQHMQVGVQSRPLPRGLKPLVEQKHAGGIHRRNQAVPGLTQRHKGALVPETIDLKTVLH